jgi:Domain of unknown function (DUF4440)
MTGEADIVRELEHINAEILAAENAGDAAYFRSRLAPAFAMRRATGKVVDAGTFVADLTPGGERAMVRDSTIPLFVDDCRAVLALQVEMPVDGEMTRFHNLRVFVRQPGGDWKLLSWANELA